ncbi:MAG TPA: hypothetical protein PLO79_06350 [Candidatus Marinimicrobia bacterium]|nr:hypothetical protein [Candidatus Neomarinimicrobiota bacterium]
MKKFFAGFGLILLASIGFAQNYHITDFIPDSLKTWQVYGTLNSSLSGDDSENERKVIGSAEYKDEDKNSSKSLTPTVFYKYMWLTPNQEFSINSNISVIYEQSNNRSDQNDILNSTVYVNDVTNKNIDGTFQGIIEYTRYLFYQNRLGVSIGTNFNLNENNHKTKNLGKHQFSNNDYWEKYNNDRQRSSQSVSLYPGIVYGRIYNGNYAAKAEEILTELKKQNLIARDLTVAEFQEFSQLIMNHVAAYHYDSRIKNIEALTDIMSYLESIGVLKELDIASFVTINDIYLFSPARKIRNFGTQFYLQSGLIYSPYVDNYEKDNWYRRWYADNGVFYHDSLLENHRSVTSDKNRVLSHSYWYEIGFERYLVKSWHLWYNYGAYFDHSFSPQRRTKKLKVEYIDILNDTSYVGTDVTSRSFNRSRSNEIAAFAGFNYQFNSRSVVSLPVSVAYSRDRIHWSSGSKSIIYRTNASIGVEFTYYLTPKWSLTTSGRIGHNHYRYSLTKQTNRDTNGTLSFSMTYYW